MTSKSEYDLTTATWHKSSYSDASGGSCLEMATWHKSSYSDASGGSCLEMATWRKSTHSDGSGGNCVEVGDGHPDLVPVRDSKVPDGPHLIFGGPAWKAFVTSL
ncbi:DUF397 domain-containing protein [Streptomyces sp. NRRL F-4428]|uniref:DUF397 domain-containing protein n=1 Tax=Streptomyces sp. NRRL F-4428 TaxID=1609137 RepID=UPI0005ED3A1F|nr:DUF397 domain-containing protein [Streptomyces sp. NRRL F-4428]KJK47400.1 toxin [Streptomyces sp. NRRL F-4428]